MKKHWAAALIAAVSVAAIAMVVAWFALRQPQVDIDDATATKLSVAADQLCEMQQHHDISLNDWPDAVRKLHPKSVRITSDGMYIVFGSMFVTERGLFVLRTGVQFTPGFGTDPSYRKLRCQVYRYEIKG